MFKKLIKKIINTPFIADYRQMWPFVRPYWGMALLAMLITIPVGALDAVIAWALKPYMDVMMIEKNENRMYFNYFLIKYHNLFL